MVGRYVAVVAGYQLADTLFGSVQVAAPRASGLTESELGLLVGITGVALFVFDYPSGVVADRIGRRQTLIAALVLTSLGMSLYGSARSLGLYLGAAIVWASGMAAFSGTPQSLLVDHLAPDRPRYAELHVLPRTNAVTNAISALGGVLATLVIASHGIHAPLIAGAIVSLAVLTVVVPFMHEPKRLPSAETFHAEFRSASRAFVSSPTLRLAAVISFFGTVPLTTFVLLWQLTAVEQVGFADSSLGLLLMAFFLAFAAGSWLAANLMQRLNAVRVSALAQFLAALGLFVLAVFETKPAFVLGGLSAELGLGLFAGSFVGWTQLLMTPERRAAHTSALGAVSSLAFLLGPVTAGAIAEHHGVPWAWAIGVACALAMSLFLSLTALGTVVGTRQRPSPTD
jgi:MFS family permease